MNDAEIDAELRQGAKFVVFQYCVSIIIMTFRRPSNIYFIKSGKSPFLVGLPYTLLSLFAGWWGFPWGPIYTIGSVLTNLRGGKDVTKTLMEAINK